MSATMTRLIQADQDSPGGIFDRLSAGRVLHSSLGQGYDLGPDIYRDQFGWLLEHQAFKFWQASEQNWQLRCWGRPGSGKTTFAALALEKLRETNAGPRDAVASVFIRQDATANECAFIEDFLVVVFGQLCSQFPSTALSLDTTRHVAKYIESRDDGRRGATRIRLIRQALQSHLSSLDHAFLVVDGVDRCSSAIEHLLDNVLAQLRGHGLRVLTTSRVPCLDLRYTCDRDECPNSAGREHIWWDCQRCRSNGDVFILCNKDRQQGLPCGRCGETSVFIQPYDHVEIDITPSELQVKRFISWSLENEHGDLQLNSKNPRKPPRSALGRELVASHSVIEHRDGIVLLARENMALARARLEAFHSMASLDDLSNYAKDTLPANIVSLFNAGLGRILQQNSTGRQLGLQAIAAVTHEPSGRIRGRDLELWLREVGRLSDAPTLPHRSLEEVLQAAQGFLVPEVPLGEEEFFIAPYCYEFYVFAAEGYNEELSWAMAELRFGRLNAEQGGKRSKTFHERIPGKPKDLLYRVPVVDRESWGVEMSKGSAKQGKTPGAANQARKVKFEDSTTTNVGKPIRQRLLRRDTASPRMEGTDSPWP